MHAGFPNTDDDHLDADKHIGHRPYLTASNPRYRSIPPTCARPSGSTPRGQGRSCTSPPRL